MRIKTIAGAVASAALASTGAHAGSAAGYADTLGGFGKYAVSIEYQRADNMDLDYDEGSFRIEELGLVFGGDFPELGDELDPGDAKFSRAFLQGTVGVHERVDLFVRLGVAAVDWDTTVEEPGFSKDRYKVDGDHDFAWGVGFRAKLWESANGFRVLASGQYTSQDSDGSAKVNGRGITGVVVDDLIDAGAVDVSADAKSSTETKEWEAALIVAKAMSGWTPYLGVRYVDIELENRTTVKGTESGSIPFSRHLHQKYDVDDQVGGIVGVDFAFNDNLSLNVEALIRPGTTIGSSLVWRF